MHIATEVEAISGILGNADFDYHAKIVIPKKERYYYKRDLNIMTYIKMFLFLESQKFQNISSPLQANLYILSKFPTMEKIDGVKNQFSFFFLLSGEIEPRESGRLPSIGSCLPCVRFR